MFEVTVCGTATEKEGEFVGALEQPLPLLIQAEPSITVPEGKSKYKAAVFVMFDAVTAPFPLIYTGTGTWTLGGPDTSKKYCIDAFAIAAPFPLTDAVAVKLGDGCEAVVAVADAPPFVKLLVTGVAPD